MRTAAFILAFVLAVPGVALAGENIDDNFIEACELWHVPQRLARAIAGVESGLHPWAVNVEGEGYIPKTPEEASAIIDRAWAAGRSIDVGLMQVNSYWMRKYGLDPHLLLQPRENIIMGTWILAQEIKRFGLTWRAVASYHTPVARNPERGKRYALMVIGSIRKARQGR